MSGRIFIDKSNLNTIMASAKPTGSQASDAAANKLLAVLTSVHLPDQIDKKINNAFKDFFKARGLNFPCRILDYFIMSGDRNLARKYLISLECIYLLSKIPSEMVYAIRPRLHEYLQNIGILEKSECFQSSLEMDQNLVICQSPHATGLIFSHLFALSNNPESMMDSCEVTQFRIRVDKPWDRSFINQKGENATCREFPADAKIRINDEALPFNGYAFNFRSASTAENIFCQHFMLSRRLGNTPEESKSFISCIHDNTTRLAEAIKKHDQLENRLKQEFSESINKKEKLKTLFSTNSDSGQLLRGINEHFNFTATLSNTCKEFVAHCNAGKKIAVEFSAYNPLIENDCIGNLVVKVLVGNKQDIEFTFTDERKECEVLEQDSKCFSPTYWNQQLQSDLHNRASETIRLYAENNEAQRVNGQALIDQICNYHTAAGNLNTQVERYERNYENVKRKEEVLNQEFTPALDAATGPGLITSEIFMPRSSLKGHRSNLISTRKNITHQPSGSFEIIDSQNEYNRNFTAIKSWVNQCVGIQQAIVEGETIRNDISTTDVNHRKLRNNLKDQISHFVGENKGDTINIHADQYDAIKKRWENTNKKISNILQMIEDKGIVTKEFLAQCEQMEVKERLARIDHIVSQYLTLKMAQKSAGMNEAIGSVW